MAALMMGMTVVGLTACGNNKNGANAANAGSTSMEKLCEALSESFMAKYPGISVTAEEFAKIYKGEITNWSELGGKDEAKVASTPRAIGYVSLDVLDDSVTTLALGGVEPTEENILAGDYLLSRPFVMATNGEISEQNELVKTWFDYVKSEEGQNVISSIGLILPE